MANPVGELHNRCVSVQRVTGGKRRKVGYVRIQLGEYGSELDALNPLRNAFYESLGGYDGNPIEGEDFEIGWERGEETAFSHVAESEFRQLESG